MADETVFEKIARYAKAVLGFLMSDEDQDGIPLVVEWAVIVVQIIGSFKNPMELTEAEKRQAARVLLEAGKYISVEQLERMLEIKKTGALDNLQSQTLDLILGDVTARFVAERKKKEIHRFGKFGG